MRESGLLLLHEIGRKDTGTQFGRPAREAQAVKEVCQGGSLGLSRRPHGRRGVELTAELGGIDLFESDGVGIDPCEKRWCRRLLRRERACQSESKTQRHQTCAPAHGPPPLFTTRIEFPNF